MGMGGHVALTSRELLHAPGEAFDETAKEARVSIQVHGLGEGY